MASIDVQRQWLDFGILLGSFWDSFGIVFVSCGTGFANKVVISDKRLLFESNAVTLVIVLTFDYCRRPAAGEKVGVWGVGSASWGGPIKGDKWTGRLLFIRLYWQRRWLLLAALLTQDAMLNWWDAADAADALFIFFIGQYSFGCTAMMLILVNY